MILCFFPILIVGCSESQEDKVKEYLKHQYPYEFTEVIRVDNSLDSVYDPFDTLNVIFNEVGHLNNKPDIDLILNDKQHPKNAIGRKARVKVYSYEKEIIVFYDSSDKVLHTSLQNEHTGERIMTKYFEKFHERDLWNLR